MVTTQQLKEAQDEFEATGASPIAPEEPLPSNSDGTYPVTQAPGSPANPFGYGVPGSVSPPYGPPSTNINANALNIGNAANADQNKMISPPVIPIGPASLGMAQPITTPAASLLPTPPIPGDNKTSALDISSDHKFNGAPAGEVPPPSANINAASEAPAAARAAAASSSASQVKGAKEVPTLTSINDANIAAHDKNQQPVMKSLQDLNAAQSYADQFRIASQQKQQEMYQQMMSDQQAHAAAQDQAKVLAQQAAAGRQAKIDAEIANIAKVDPDRRSIPAKILGAFAMALGAYGQGINHTRTNGAMDIIDSQVAGDVAAQKSNIEKQWKQVSAHMDSDQKANLRDQYMIEQNSQIAERQYKIYQNDLANSMAGAQNAQAFAGAQGVHSEIASKIEGLQNQSVDRSTSFALQELNERRAKANAAASAAAAFQKAEQLRAQKIQDRVAEEGGKLLENGTYTNPLESRAASETVNGYGNSNPVSLGSAKNKESMVVDMATGQPRQAVSPKAAETYETTQNTTNQMEAAVKEYRAAIESGDQVAQAAAKGRLTDILPGLSDSKRLPGMGQIESVAPDMIPSGGVGNTPATALNATRRTGSWSTEKTAQLHQLDELDKIIKTNRHVITTATFGSTKASDIPGTTATSDRNAKTNIKPAAKEIDTFLQQTQKAMQVLLNRKK